MGRVINLYVIPRHQVPSNLRAAQVAEALVSEHLVAPPVVIGPALGAHGHRLVQPQSADDPFRLIDLARKSHKMASVMTDDADFVRRSRRYVELPPSFADFGGTDEPQIAAFTRLDETNPAIRSDFSHYTGPECSVGIYVAPKGTRLLLTDEKITWDRDDKPVVESYVAFDATIFEWLHLQGKAAPWLDIYRGSCVDRAIRIVWPQVDVVENGG
jgi:hypothetical protein